jgi:hypothetical protein
MHGWVNAPAALPTLGGVTEAECRLLTGNER